MSDLFSTPPRTMPARLVEHLTGGQGTVFVTVNDAGEPHAAFMSWVVAPDPQRIRVAVDSRGQAFRNMVTNPNVALEILGDDLIFSVSGRARVAREQLSTAPFPCAMVEVEVTGCKDQRVEGIHFKGPEYTYVLEKEHRNEFEARIFEELMASE